MNVGESLPNVEKFVTEDHVNRYADVSGDRNPIHVDTEFAATSRSVSYTHLTLPTILLV